MTYHNIISYNMTSANLSNTAMCNVYIFRDTGTSIPKSPSSKRCPVGMLCPTLASVLEEGKEAPMHKVFPCAMMMKLEVSFNLLTTIPSQTSHLLCKNMHFPLFNGMFIHFPICSGMIPIFFYSD